MDNNENGKWITVKGRHVFIKDGESFDDAMARSLNNSEESDESGEEKEIWKDPEVQKQVAMNTAKMFGAKDVTVNGERIDLNNSVKVTSGDPMEEMAEQRVHDKEQTLYNDKVILDYMNKEGISEINGTSKEDLEKQISDKEKYIETARPQYTADEQDILNRYTEDYGWDDNDGLKNLKHQIDYMRNPNESINATAQRLVGCGDFLIYNGDIEDYLNERNIKHNEDNFFDVYKKDMAGKIEDLYNRASRTEPKNKTENYY